MAIELERDTRPRHEDQWRIVNGNSVMVLTDQELRELVRQAGNAGIHHPDL